MYYYTKFSESCTCFNFNTRNYCNTSQTCTTFLIVMKRVLEKAGAILRIDATTASSFMTMGNTVVKNSAREEKFAVPVHCTLQSIFIVINEARFLLWSSAKDAVGNIGYGWKWKNVSLDYRFPSRSTNRRFVNNKQITTDYTTDWRILLNSIEWKQQLRKNKILNLCGWCCNSNIGECKWYNTQISDNKLRNVDKINVYKHMLVVIAVKNSL